MATRGTGCLHTPLLDGLSNKKEADKNNDNIISLVELGEYAKQTTSEISKKAGSYPDTVDQLILGKTYPCTILK